MKTPGLLSLLVLALLAPRASAADLQTLIARSPFAPAGGPQLNLGDAPAEQSTLEFRGLVIDESGPSYSVFDASQNRGFWIREGGDGPLRVRSYNAQESLLEVEQNGRATKLQLKRASVQNGAAPAPRPVAAVQPAGGQPGAVGPSNPDGRRLEAVAAEVRRRRALRNAAAKPAAEAPAPPPAPAQ